MEAEWAVRMQSGGWPDGSGRVGRWAGLAVALMVTGALSLSLGGVVQRAGVARLVSRGATRAAGLGRLESLPAQAQSVISATLGAGEPVFVARRSGPGYRLGGGGVLARLGARRVDLGVRWGSLSMTSLALGRGGRLSPAGVLSIGARANRVSYDRGRLAEWYGAGPLGIGQGFTVSKRPGGAAGPLTLALGLAGSLRPRQSGSQVRFLTSSGRLALRYGGLQAIDASGRRLRAALEVQGAELLVRVWDRGARYPLRIDPLIQQGEKLTGAGEIASGRFGYSVALSANGDTALIGARYDTPNGNEAGGAWVFTRSGSTWTQQGGKLNGTGHAGETLFDHIGEGEFGASVALSADGDTALIGAPRENYYDGAAWVFTRSGSAWTQQGEKLTGTGESGKGELGKSVVLSADGDTALIGGPADNSGAGAAWVFTRSGFAWTQQGEKLSGGGETGGGEFGSGVALSGDGDTALIGGPGDSGSTGAAWVFTRSGSAWTQQGEKLSGGGETGEGKFGSGVALSGDGSTALIGGPGDNGSTGAAWVFTRSGAAWTQQGEKLSGGGETGEGEFGASVGLSETGDTALIGGPHDNGSTGAVWVLTRSGGVWRQQGPKLTGGEEGNSQFGVLVALSADGNTALIGGPGDNNDAGAAWVFTRSGGVWSQQGPKLTGAGETGIGGIGGFGVSVALSADGNTALIGAPGDNGGLFGKGAAWVFTRTDGIWTQQGEKLVGDCTSSCANQGTGEIENAWFGYNVALSADGDTALIGGFRDNNWRGAAWVFTRSGSTWTQQGEKLVGDCTGSCANQGTGETGAGMFGTMVALSADGSTALIGAWNDDNVLAGNEHYSGKGAAWVFTRSGSTWTQQGEKLVGDCTGSCANQGTGETGAGRFGVTVALSADGDTALIGGLDDNSTRGAAWLFTRSGSTWTEQGEKFTGGGEGGEGEFGTNVALSADGGTAMIGAWRDNGGRGAAWVFADLPTAATGAATGVGATSATLNGTLGAGGSSTAYFQYGTTAAYGSSTASQSVGASSGPRPLAAAIGGLAPGTTYHFRLLVENPDGVVYGGDQTFTTEARGATSTTETITTPPTQPATTSPSIPSETPSPPTVAHVRQSATRWRESNQLARISRAKTPTGTTFSFSLNEQATVTFSFAQLVGGREGAHGCLARTHANAQRKSCSYALTRGMLSFTGHDGTNSVRFTGRVSHTVKLKPGRYTLVITATNTAGQKSAPQKLSFTIVQ